MNLGLDGLVGGRVVLRGLGPPNEMAGLMFFGAGCALKSRPCRLRDAIVTSHRMRTLFLTTSSSCAARLILEVVALSG
jgi:hypothetical protein